MTKAERISHHRALALRLGIVAVFAVATAIVVATRPFPAARPTLAPLAMAVAAAFMLWAADRFDGRPATTVAKRWARLGMYLMGASTVLGVANTWYAFLDPARNGWFSGLFLVGSALAMTAFAWLGDLDGAEAP